MPDISRLPKPLVAHWEWQIQAACRGMDTATFFHPPNERDAAREGRIAQAKAICSGCPAIDDCRNHALRVREPYGVWGGLCEDERASLLGVESLRYPKTPGWCRSRRTTRRAHHRCTALTRRRLIPAVANAAAHISCTSTQLRGQR